VQAAWAEFWTAVILGDLNGARKYVHSQRQNVFPRKGQRIEDLQEIAQQMAYCRLDPTPFPIDHDEVIYLVLCEHGSERAETIVGVRRDLDGIWRFSVM
jgi:hypothetical protein